MATHTIGSASRGSLEGSRLGAVVRYLVLVGGCAGAAGHVGDLSRMWLGLSNGAVTTSGGAIF